MHGLEVLLLDFQLRLSTIPNLFDNAANRPANFVARANPKEEAQ
jgi:hypothetical protein